jgi:hypothetical protein
MTAKYYVAVRPQTNDYHAVHKQGCPFLHDDSKNIFLGLFKSGHDALSESRHAFNRTENCYFCCREEKIPRENIAIQNRTEQDAIPLRLQKPVPFHQEMFCCLN